MPDSAQAAAGHASTGFPLAGYHAHLPCDACHGEREPSPVCNSCHQSPHGADFKKPCEDCHSAGRAFAEVHFRHPSDDFFALHQDIECARCHQGRIFGRTSRSCTTCHTDFHKGALGTDCYRCHRSTAWSVTGFNHDTSGFPLTGAHSALECGDCHRDLQSLRIVPRPTECASCHEKDYRTSPFDHVAYSAGNNCQECHLQDTWSYAHSPAWFNIQTGHHAGISCGTCHKDSRNYFEYTCHDCHRAHSDDNNGRCLDCHPGGFPRGED